MRAWNIPKRGKISISTRRDVLRSRIYGELVIPPSSSWVVGAVGTSLTGDGRTGSDPSSLATLEYRSFLSGHSCFTVSSTPLLHGIVRNHSYLDTPNPKPLPASDRTRFDIDRSWNTGFLTNTPPGYQHHQP